jgi:hypothetical protein
LGANFGKSKHGVFIDPCQERGIVGRRPGITEPGIVNDLVVGQRLQELDHAVAILEAA